MAGATLYFSNADTQAVQKITGVIAAPEIYTLGDTEEIYKAPHRDIFEELYPDEIGSSATSEYESQSSYGLKTLSTSAVTGSGTANATSSRIWAFKTLVVSTVEQHSDERVHAPHRQDRIKLNYWKVTFSAASGQPTYAMLSLSEYPSFAPDAPGWWTDPNP